MLFRDYRWIVAPAILIVIFLLNVSWAQSQLTVGATTQYTMESAEAGANLRGMMLRKRDYASGFCRRQNGLVEGNNR